MNTLIVFSTCVFVYRIGAGRKMGKAETINSVANHVITEEEEKLISQLRENVKDLLPTKITEKSELDHQKLYLVRWIRARENNLDKATAMLKNHLEWRVKRNADEIFAKVIDPFFNETYKTHFVGTDREGRPVICVNMSEWDFRKVVADPELLAQFDDFATRLFENFLKILETENNKRSGKGDRITQMTFLIDVKDYPKGQLIRVGAIRKILEIAQIYEAHYPEVLFQGHFINTPSYFGLFMALIKPILASKTYKKIQLHSDFKKWQEELSEIVDPAIVPTKYGGSLAE